MRIPFAEITILFKKFKISYKKVLLFIFFSIFASYGNHRSNYFVYNYDYKVILR